MVQHWLSEVLPWAQIATVSPNSTLTMEPEKRSWILGTTGALGAEVCVYGSDVSWLYTGWVIRKLTF